MDLIDILVFVFGSIAFQYLSTWVHEFGHAIEARRLGCVVTSVGTGFGKKIVAWNVGRTRFFIRRGRGGCMRYFHPEESARTNVVIRLTAAGPVVDGLWILAWLRLCTSSHFPHLWALAPAVALRLLWWVYGLRPRTMKAGEIVYRNDFRLILDFLRGAGSANVINGVKWYVLERDVALEVGDRAMAYYCMIAEAFDLVNRDSLPSGEDEAADKLRAAGEMTDKRDRLMQAHFALMRSAFSLRTGRWQEALDHGRESERLFETLRRRTGAANARLCQAEAALRAGKPSLAVAPLEKLRAFNVTEAVMVKSWAGFTQALSEKALDRLGRAARAVELAGVDARPACRSIWLLQAEVDRLILETKWAKAFDYGERALEQLRAVVPGAPVDVRGRIAHNFVDVVESAASIRRRFGRDDDAFGLHEMFGEAIGYPGSTSDEKPVPSIRSIQLSRMRLTIQATGYILLAIAMSTWSRPGAPLSAQTWRDNAGAYMLSYSYTIAGIVTLIHAYAALKWQSYRWAPAWFVLYALLPWILMAAVNR